VTKALPASPAPFIVDLPVFRGTLTELASALRARQLLPGEVPMLRLTRRVLEHVDEYRASTTDSADLAELLPPLATVIALKARLLIPQPDVPEALPEDDDFIEEFAQSVDALAELDVLVSFLSARRRERERLIPARPIDLGLPRRERKVGPGGLAKLVKAARAAVREVSVPLVERERTTLAQALTALRAYATRLRHFVFHAVPTQDWGERTTYFSALLEGVKNGEFDARQDAPYAPIEVECVRVAQAEPDEDIAPSLIA